MWRFWAAALAVAGMFLLVFLGATILGWEIEDPSTIMPGASMAAAFLGIALLSVDVVAPVPASLVMIANGMLFGFALGTALSFLGGMIAFALGFAIGRTGDERFGRLLGHQATDVQHFAEKRGYLAIAATRPIPILAETTAVLAGASRLAWLKALVAAGAGVLAQALVYAMVGAAWLTFAPGSVVFLATLFGAAALYLIAVNLPRLRPDSRPSVTGVPGTETMEP